MDVEGGSEVVGISHLSRATGASLRALRYYETKNLLHPVRDRNGERLYPPAQRTRAQDIVRLRLLGLRLDEIRPLLDEDGSAADRLSRRRHVLERHVAQIETVLQEMREELSRLARQVSSERWTDLY